MKLIKVEQHKNNYNGVFFTQVIEKKILQEHFWPGESGVEISKDCQDNYNALVVNPEYFNSIEFNLPPDEYIFWGYIYFNGMKINRIEEIYKIFKSQRPGKFNLLIPIIEEQKMAGKKVDIFKTLNTGKTHYIKDTKKNKKEEKHISKYIKPKKDGYPKRIIKQCKCCTNKAQLYVTCELEERLEYICSTCSLESDYYVKPDGPGNIPPARGRSKTKIKFNSSGRKKVEKKDIFSTLF